MNLHITIGPLLSLIAGILIWLYVRTARRWRSALQPMFFILIGCAGPAITIIGDDQGWSKSVAVGLAITSLSSGVVWFTRQAWQFNIMAAVGVAVAAEALAIRRWARAFSRAQSW